MDDVIIASGDPSMSYEELLEAHEQGWYHTVRVPFGIDTIQYSRVLYGIA